MAGNFDKNIEQIPYLVLGEVFLEVSAILDDLVQRYIYFLVVNLRLKIFTVRKLFWLVFVHTKQLLSFICRGTTTRSNNYGVALSFCTCFFHYCRSLSSFVT